MIDKLTDFDVKYPRTKYNAVIFIALVIVGLFLFLNSDKINIKIFYYFIAYFFVLATYLLRTYVKAKQENENFSLYKIFFISIDISFIALGAIISQAKLVKNSDGQSSLILITIVIIIISIVIELIEEKHVFIKLTANLAIILIIVFYTIFMFNSLKSNIFLNKYDEYDEITNNYEVIIPYNDLTLSKHIGESKFGNRKLIFVKFVKSNDSKSAKDMVVREFKSKVKPIYDYKMDLQGQNQISFNEEDVIVR